MSSFGISGTNAHVIVEQAPVLDGVVGQGVSPESLPVSSVSSGGPVAWVVSGKSERALVVQARRLLEFVAADEGLSVVDVGWCRGSRSGRWWCRRGGCWSLWPLMRGCRWLMWGCRWRGGRLLSIGVWWWGLIVGSWWRGWRSWRLGSPVVVWWWGGLVWWVSRWWCFPGRGLSGWGWVGSCMGGFRCLRRLLMRWWGCWMGICGCRCVRWCGVRMRGC
ncbi:hypothetical protein H7J74_00165 [Mycobacterium angelicum]|nr:hypothetical protein [Mycobacterium angelicum]